MSRFPGTTRRAHSNVAVAVAVAVAAAFSGTAQAAPSVAHAFAGNGKIECVVGVWSCPAPRLVVRLAGVYSPSGANAQMTLSEGLFDPTTPRINCVFVAPRPYGHNIFVVGSSDYNSPSSGQFLLAIGDLSTGTDRGAILTRGDDASGYCRPDTQSSVASADWTTLPAIANGSFTTKP